MGFDLSDSDPRKDERIRNYERGKGKKVQDHGTKGNAKEHGLVWMEGDRDASRQNTEKRHAANTLKNAREMLEAPSEKGRVVYSPEDLDLVTEHTSGMKLLRGEDGKMTFASYGSSEKEVRDNRKHSRELNPRNKS